MDKYITSCIVALTVALLIAWPVVPAQAQQGGAGEQEHRKVLQAYGGVYDEPKVSGYVAAVGGRIAANSELPKSQFRFTVLDSPDVNAFALPGGYIYVTRGLVALANSEAELASVLAHEIGHVTAKHSAQRQNRSIGMALGGALLGALTKNKMLSDLANQGGQLYLLSYSRQQEFEADQLGIRYLTQAGYDPYAGADFLEAMEQHASLESTLRGEQAGARSDFLSTHPTTPKRIVEAIGQAKATGLQIAARPRLQDEFYKTIDGMVYGGSAEHGFIRDRTFSHPKLRFTFTAPPGFKLMDRPSAILATGPGNAQMKFDMVTFDRDIPMDAFLTQHWAVNTALRNPERLTINGLDAATGETNVQSGSGAAVRARLVAIRFQDNRVARFIMLIPDRAPASLVEEYKRMTYSFRALSQSEASRLQPMRIKIIPARSGDTVESLAANMPFADYRVGRLATLNGLPQNAALKPGTQLKLVVQSGVCTPSQRGSRYCGDETAQPEAGQDSWRNPDAERQSWRNRDDGRRRARDPQR